MWPRSKTGAKPKPRTEVDVNNAVGAPHGTLTQVSGTPLKRGHVLSVIKSAGREVKVHIIQNGRKNGAATLEINCGSEYYYREDHDFFVTAVRQVTS